jgi:site-specific DNA recombinase
MHEVEVIKANRKISDRTAGKVADILRVAPYARVSTDSEEQLNSYKSQVMYYTDLVKKRKDWVLVDIYADEAITGTQVTKRENFQRMINDCMDGKIDMIITKSISRFARNTLDTLKYVRMLKERNIAVFFEDENINTLTMDGELLLVILSSVAQQEVENISANVKKGLKMKMKRGELVGFQSCLGYDYNPNDKSISINEAEADIVRYIFNRYIDGAGAYVIAKELTSLGYKTKNGNTEWHDTTVLGIIKNEKYKGDVLQGKTFTVDPISKRRLDNYGEEDQFYIKNHHEPIISEEIFEKAQAILDRRGAKRSGVEKGKREKYSRQYAFSSKLECAFCGSNLSRRNWHSGSAHEKVIWQCVTATKKGKKYCPPSKAIEEKILESAFVESYKLLCQNNSDVLDELIERMESVLSKNDFQKQLVKVENEIHAIEQKRNRLVDMRLEETIDKATYEKKYSELESILEGLLTEREQLEQFKKELGSHNQPDIERGFDNTDFMQEAKPVGNEGIAEDANQLAALCMYYDVNHLIYVGFAINWCLLLSPGGMFEMSQKGLLCSTIRQAVTAVENKDTARYELCKEIGLWRVSLAFGFVYELDDLIDAL